MFLQCAHDSPSLATYSGMSPSFVGSSHRGIPMCAATSRAICSCDWGSEGDTPIAATHRGDAPDRSSSSSSSSSSSPAPNARWTTCATSEESTPPEKATTCIRAPAPAARVDSTIASSSRASRASSSPSPAASSAMGGRASTFVVVGRGRRRTPRVSLRWRPRNGDASARVAVPAGNARAAPTAIERVIVHSPRVLSSASTASGCKLFLQPYSPETVPTPRTNVRELSRRRRPCRRRARNPPPSVPRSSRSAG